MVQKMTVNQSMAGSSASWRALARASSSAASPVSASADVVDAILDAAREVAGAEARQDPVLDDDLRQRVGEDRLEPVADLDADLALVGRDDEEDAVIELGGADAPMAAELIAEILDRIALQGGQRHDHELVGALVLERLELRRQRLPVFRAQQSGVVHHAAGERGEGGLGGRRQQRQAERYDERQQG